LPLGTVLYRAYILEYPRNSLVSILFRKRKRIMSKGPQGQNRPADAIGCAVMVARIATGEIQETPKPSNRVKSGKAGAAARAAILTPEERTAIARKSADARWDA
jgi:hypothetical protein